MGLHSDGISEGPLVGSAEISEERVEDTEGENASGASPSALAYSFRDAPPFAPTIDNTNASMMASSTGMLGAQSPYPDSSMSSSTAQLPNSRFAPSMNASTIAGKPASGMSSTMFYSFNAAGAPIRNINLKQYHNPQTHNIFTAQNMQQQDDDDDDNNDNLIGGNKSSRRPSRTVLLHQLPLPLSESKVLHEGDARERLIGIASHGGVQTKRKFRDIFFGLVFLCCFAIMTISGILACCFTQRIEEDAYISDTIWLTMQKSKTLLTFIVVFAIIVGALWIQILQRFVKPLTWTMIILIPAGCISLSGWTMYSAFSGRFRASGRYDPQDDWLIFASLVAFLAGAAFSVFLWKRRSDVEKSVHILTLSCMVLQDNPSMFAASFALMMGYVLFCIMWLAFFTRLFLMGNITRMGDGAVKWIPTPGTALLALFFVFMFFWTSSIFTNVQRAMLAGVTCEWYFHRHDQARQVVRETLRSETNNAVLSIESLKRAVTFSFGSMCLAGLVLASIQIIQVIAAFLRRRNLPQFLTFIVASFNALEKLVDGVNSYAIIYLSMTGDDFHTAALQVTQIFHRNFLYGMASGKRSFSACSG